MPEKVGMCVEDKPVDARYFPSGGVVGAVVIVVLDEVQVAFFSNPAQLFR